MRVIALPCGNVFLVNMGLNLCFLSLWKQWLSWGGKLYSCSAKKKKNTEQLSEQEHFLVHTQQYWNICALSRGMGGSNIPCLCRTEAFLRSIPAEVSKPKKEKKSMEVLEKSFLFPLHIQMPKFCLAGRDEIPMDTEQERSLKVDLRKGVKPWGRAESQAQSQRNSHLCMDFRKVPLRKSKSLRNLNVCF